MRNGWRFRLLVSVFVVLFGICLLGYGCVSVEGLHVGVGVYDSLWECGFKFHFHFAMPGSIVLYGFWYVELWIARICQLIFRPLSSLVNSVPSTISSMLTFAMLHWSIYMWVVSSLSGVCRRYVHRKNVHGITGMLMIFGKIIA